MTRRWTKWIKIVLPGCILTGYAAGCFGGDPTFFFSSTITSAVVFSVVNALVTSLLSGLTTTAMLLG